MKKSTLARNSQPLIITVVVILICQCVIGHAAEKFSVGVVPQFDARRITEIWQPVLEEVSRISGVQLELKISPSIPVFEQQFNHGWFDFAYMNPYHAIVANKMQGYEPLFRDTGRMLYGIIVVKKDSAIKSVKELDGKTVAFPAPNALGAALIPRTEFARKFKIKVEELYVKSHSSVYLNVLLGIAEAGGGVQKTLAQQPENVQDELRVLYKTTKVAPHPFVAHQRVPKNIRDKITAAFLKLGSTSEGAKMLAKIPINKIGKADIQDYDPLRKMGLQDFYVD